MNTHKKHKPYKMDTIKKNRGKKQTIDIFREVCEAKAGIAGDIAAALNIRRSTLYGWLKNDPEFSAVFDEAREKILDMAENRLRTLIQGVPKFEIDDHGEKQFAGWIEKPSETAIIFTLKTRGKKRGYVERQEITGANGADILPPRTLTPEEAREYLMKLESEY